MPGLMNHLQTVNSFLRTLLALIVIGAMGAGGWFAYSNYYAAEFAAKRAETDLADAQQQLQVRETELAEKRREIEKQQATLRDQEKQIADQTATIETQAAELVKKDAEIRRLDTALRLHKLERRLARIHVVEITTDETTGKKTAVLDFVELNDAGDPIGQPKRFTIEGDMVYIDYLVVIFEDKYVEQADLERGMSVCMFNRIFGEFQNPKDGFVLDEPGQHPGAYARGGLLSDFEKKLWSDFWTIANDPEQAAELGIRTLHGKAVSTRVQKGKNYRITVRSSSGPEISVETDEAPKEPAKPAI